MELYLNQRQLSMLIKGSVNQRLKMYEQDATSAPVAGTDPEAAKPSAGTGDTGAKTGYPEVTKWESGIERGPDNQVAVTKWSDIVGSKITRGKSNPLTENEITKENLLSLLNEQGGNYNFMGKKYQYYTPDGKFVEEFKTPNKPTDGQSSIAPKKQFNLNTTKTYPQIDDILHPDNKFVNADRPDGSIDADLIFPKIPKGGYPKQLTGADLYKLDDFNIKSRQYFRNTQRYQYLNPKIYTKGPSDNQMLNFLNYNRELDSLHNEWNKEDSKPLVNWGGKTYTAGEIYKDSFDGNPKNNQRVKDEDALLKKYFPINKQKTLLRADDGDALIVNVWKGEFSEALLDAREYFFESYIGIGVEIAVSYALAEFGGTIAMETLNAMFLFNDTYVMFNNMDVDLSRRLPEDKKGTWESIGWLWNNNPDFQNVIVDLCIVLGTIAMKKLSGNLPGVLSFLKSKFPNFADFIKAIKNAKNKFIDLALAGPKKMIGWLRSIFKYFDDFCNLLERSAATPDKVGKTLVRVAKLPRVIANAALFIMALEFGPRTFSLIKRAMGITSSKNLSQEEQLKFESKQPVVVQQELPKIVSKDVESAKKDVENLIVNNKDAYGDLCYSQLINEKKINCKRNEFSVTKEKYDGETVFMILNKKYYINESDSVVQINK